MMDLSKIQINEDDPKQTIVDLTERAKAARENKQMLLYKSLLMMIDKIAEEYFIDDEFLVSTRYL